MDLQLDFYSDWIALLQTELVGMGYTIPAGTAPRDVALLYFNALFRRIPKKPRQILKSRELQCPPQLQNGLNWLEQKVANGDDLNPHLSRKTKKLDYDDALLNDWGIFHFHLGTAFRTDGLVDSTDPVLFARVTDSDFYEIHTASHGTWADLDLIEILHTNWPQAIEHRKLPQALALQYVPDTAAIEKLRKDQLNTAIQTNDGTIYGQFGGGYASDGTSTVVVMNANTHTSEVKELEKWVRENIALLVEKLKTAGYTEHAPLKAKFVVDSDGWYASFPDYNYSFKLKAKTGRVR